MSSNAGNRKTTVRLPAPPTPTTTHPHAQTQSKRNGSPSSPGSTTRGPTAADIQLLRQKIVDLIDKKPDQAAKLLSLWVNQAPNQHKKQKKTG